MWNMAYPTEPAFAGVDATGWPYLIMPYFSAADIHNLIKHINPYEKLLVFLAIILELQSLQLKNIYHGDIRGQNILSTKISDQNEQCKISFIDFGRSKRTNSTELFLTDFNSLYCLIHFYSRGELFEFRKKLEDLKFRNQSSGLDILNCLTTSTIKLELAKHAPDEMKSIRWLRDVLESKEVKQCNEKAYKEAKELLDKKMERSSTSLTLSLLPVRVIDHKPQENIDDAIASSIHDGKEIAIKDTQQVSLHNTNPAVPMTGFGSRFHSGKVRLWSFSDSADASVKVEVTPNNVYRP